MDVREDFGREIDDCKIEEDIANFFINFEFGRSAGFAEEAVKVL